MMAGDRTAEKKAFLERHGWFGASIRPLAADASFRTYDRVTLHQQRAVLMDAPPPMEDTQPFLAVAAYLSEIGLRAPNVIAADPAHGFILLEDFGDALLARVVADAPEREAQLYQIAVNTLVRLHSAQPPSQISHAHGKYALEHYDGETLRAELELFSDWYLPNVAETDITVAADALWGALKDPLAESIAATPVVTLRDYHAENLMVLDSSGETDLGLLDFQDALLGDPAYDLVSLLQDARRDVPKALEDEMLNHYCREIGIDRSALMPRYRALGVQRNAKIIGIFCRLAKRDGKPQYLALIPRVWGLLERNLTGDEMAPIAKLLDGLIPPEKRTEVPAP